MFVRIDYPSMYLCIYFYNICTMVLMCKSLVGKKTMDVTGIFIFPSLWDSIMLSIAALKNPQLHKV